MALLLVAEDTEMKFRAVHKLLMENHYEILMVEAGVEKICLHMFTAHIKTPIGAQKPRLNLWLGFVFFSGLNTDFLLSPVCVLRFCYLWCLYDVCACLYPVLQEYCSPFYLNNSCGMQSFDSRFLTNLSSRSLKNKPKEQGTGVWGFSLVHLNHQPF